MEQSQARYTKKRRAIGDGAPGVGLVLQNMWSELFLMNKKELLAQMDLFIREFKKLRGAIESNDVETMKDMMRLSTKRRSYFNK